jgi:hypothetical protein
MWLLFSSVGGGHLWGSRPRDDCGEGRAAHHACTATEALHPPSELSSYYRNYFFGISSHLQMLVGCDFSRLYTGVRGGHSVLQK